MVKEIRLGYKTTRTRQSLCENWEDCVTFEKNILWELYFEQSVCRPFHSKPKYIRELRENTITKQSIFPRSEKWASEREKDVCKWDEVDKMDIKMNWRFSCLCLVFASLFLCLCIVWVEIDRYDSRLLDQTGRGGGCGKGVKKDGKRGEE